MADCDELAVLDQEEALAIADVRRAFEAKRQAAEARAKQRTLDARRQDAETRQRLDDERRAKEAERSAEAERIKAIEQERIAIEYEAQRARDEAALAAEQNALGVELERQRTIAAASQPKGSAQADGKFEHRQYKFADGLAAKLAAFKRACKGNSAIVLRIDHDAGEIQVQAEYAETRLDAVASDLSESTPAYLLYTFRWQTDDGRTQFPLILIGFMPPAVPPHLRVMYARPVTDLRDHLAVNKHFTCEDADDLTEEWLVHKLSGGR